MPGNSTSELDLCMKTSRKSLNRMSPGSNSAPIGGSGSCLQSTLRSRLLPTRSGHVFGDISALLFEIFEQTLKERGKASGLKKANPWPVTPRARP
ncbi:hypothetical protein LINPERHAP1_LOCUS16161, partial [Linum perenne]